MIKTCSHKRQGSRTDSETPNHGGRHDHNKNKEGGQTEAALPDTPALRKPPPSVFHCPAEMTGNITVTQSRMSV